MNRRSINYSPAQTPVDALLRRLNDEAVKLANADTARVFGAVTPENAGRLLEHQHARILHHTRELLLSEYRANRNTRRLHAVVEALAVFDRAHPALTGAPR